jgi:hypothetical protein
MNISDLMIDRATRAHACEVVIIARLLLDPGTRLVFSEPLPVTPEAGFLLDLILADSDAHHDLVASARITSHVAHLAGTVVEGTGRRAVSLAREVCGTTVGELSAIGSTNVVVDLLKDALLRRTRVGAAA